MSQLSSNGEWGLSLLQNLKFQRWNSSRWGIRLYLKHRSECNTVLLKNLWFLPLTRTRNYKNIHSYKQDPLYFYDFTSARPLAHTSSHLPITSFPFMLCIFAHVIFFALDPTFTTSFFGKTLLIIILHSFIWQIILEIYLCDNELTYNI